MERKFIVGLDLGQSSDFSALVLDEMIRLPEPTSGARVVKKPCQATGELEDVPADPDPADRWIPTRAPVPLGKTNLRPLWRHSIRNLVRFDLGTSYTTIVDKVVSLFDRTLPDGTTMAGSTLVLDATGVGRPVVDMFRKAKPRCTIRPITITGGDVTKSMPDEEGWRVPKKELVSAVKIVLQSNRIAFPSNLEHSPTLVKELEMFKVKVTKVGNETFECLTSGTLIETINGPIPINLVQEGDLVLTRDGYKKVLWAGETKRVHDLVHATWKKDSIIGTPDHLVWTENRGWVELSNIQEKDKCLSLKNQIRRADARVFAPKSLCSTALNTAVHRAASIISLRTGVPENPFIEPFGSFTTGRYQKGSMSTIRMKTPTTMTYPISSVSAIPITREFTGRENHPRIEYVPYVMNSSSLPRIVEQRNQMGYMERETLSARLGVRTSVENHESSSAYSAEKSSRRMGTVDMDRLLDSVLTGVRVKTLTCVESVPVYDLIVEDCHEFFANGILVHNSWRERDHDDMVLALAIAVWVGEQGSQELWVV